nr:hypothetical protein GCM10017611_52670 [Rhodococcus wratislaviensis]
MESDAAPIGETIDGTTAGTGGAENSGHRFREGQDPGAAAAHGKACNICHTQYDFVRSTN